MARGDVAVDGLELRCDNGALHGILRKHHGVMCIEQKCSNWNCTKGKTVTTFHYYSLETGALVDTVRYKNALERNGKKP